MSEDPQLVELGHIRRELVKMREMMTDIVFYMREAEREVPERMRRFIMYMHDIHDVKNLYDEHGITVPPHVMRECERCDDRLRQLLNELHTDGGTFEKVRREMATDPENRWEHTRQLVKPTHHRGEKDETR